MEINLEKWFWRVMDVTMILGVIMVILMLILPSTMEIVPCVDSEGSEIVGGICEKEIAHPVIMGIGAVVIINLFIGIFITMIRINLIIRRVKDSRK